MKLFHEFKQFAVKGNALDLAVAVILGTAFNKVVNSIVQDMLMPPIGMLIGRVDFRDLQIVLKAAGTNAAGAPTPEVAIRYGAFVNTTIEFLIVAFSVFVVVKFMNRLILHREAAQA